MPDPVEGQVVVDETPPLKAPLVAADSTTDVERVQDAGNRAVRTGGNVTIWTAVAYLVQKYTGLSAEDVMFAIPVLAFAFSWVFNQLEQRGYIRSLKPDDAVISAPRTTTGQLLGQSKP